MLVKPYAVKENHHISGSGWLKFLDSVIQQDLLQFAQSVGWGRANVIELSWEITSGSSTIC